MTIWISSGLVIIAGVAVGVIGRWAAARIKPAAAPKLGRHIGAFVFWFFTVLGVIIGVALLDASTLRAVPASVVLYLPRVLIAGLIIIAAWATASLGASIVRRSLTGERSRALETVVRGAVFATGLIFAFAQLGLDTTILIIIIASMLGGLGVAFALLVGLGGRSLAAELAAGRYLSRHLQEGATIHLAGRTIAISRLHPALLEGIENGRRTLVPYTEIMAGFHLD